MKRNTEANVTILVFKHISKWYKVYGNMEVKWPMFHIILHIERRNAEVKISSCIILYYIYTFRYFLSFVVVPCIDLIPRCSNVLHFSHPQQGSM